MDVELTVLNALGPHSPDTRLPLGGLLVMEPSSGMPVPLGVLAMGASSAAELSSSPESAAQRRAVNEGRAERPSALCCWVLWAHRRTGVPLGAQTCQTTTVTAELSSQA